MTSYFLLKYLHVLGAIVIHGAGIGIFIVNGVALFNPTRRGQYLARFAIWVGSVV